MQILGNAASNAYHQAGQYVNDAGQGICTWLVIYQINLLDNGANYVRQGASNAISSAGNYVGELFG